MNIFRLIADMLHLAAICLLIYRIHTTKNCIGKEILFPQQNYRYLMQDSRNILDRVFGEVCGLATLLRIRLQHSHEVLLHWRNLLLGLLYEEEIAIRCNL